MTKRITGPITQQIKKAGRQAEDILSDYSTRMFNRLRRVEAQFGEIEKSAEAAIKSSDAAQKKVAEATGIVQREFQTRNETIVRILQELYQVVQEGGEELSDVSEKLSAAQLEINEATKLANETAALARGGKWDVVNVEMLAKTAKLFTQVDAPTVKIALDEFELAVFQEALEDLGERRWLELENAFEAARKSRQG